MFSLIIFVFCVTLLVLSVGLLGKRDNAVSDTALRIVASMKRDWMQASIFFSFLL
jgi:hypothetical protein